MSDLIICSICGGGNSEEEIFSQKCDHKICWNCLSEYVVPRLTVKIKCPVTSCLKNLPDHAIRKVLSNEDINKYEEVMLGTLEHRKKCLLSECTYFIIFMDNDHQYDCPECSLFNCLGCDAPHKFISCSQYKSDEEAQQSCEEEMTRARNQLKLKKNLDTFKAMDENDVLIYDNAMECPNCCRFLPKGDIIILRCSHSFCRYCINNHIKSSKIPILCPTIECKIPLQEREIKKLISEEDLTVYIDKCNSAIKGKLNFIFHCQTQDCPFFVEYSTEPLLVYCVLCKVYNCTKCFKPHPSETCAQFRSRIQYTPYGIHLTSMERKINSRELMRCLKCHQVLKKIAGCSWIQCSNCNFEMCWALQIRRWGPGGRGDISQGCRCGVNRKYCAPNCLSCVPHN